LENPDNGLVIWLNERAKEARTYEREAWCLAQLSAKELSRSQGWILGWTLLSNSSGSDGVAREARVRVYVPEWRRQIKVVLSASVGNVGDSRSIWVKTRDGSGEAWSIEKGTGVHVTAFWDTRSTPEYRFVFSILPSPSKP
jgi:hypothetical protein